MKKQEKREYKRLPYDHNLRLAENQPYYFNINRSYRGFMSQMTLIQLKYGGKQNEG